MKTHAVLLCLCLGAATFLHSQTITDRGPHHRTLQIAKEVRSVDGRVRMETNSIIELQGGMHRLTEQGWVETKPHIEVFRDGAVARNLQYQAIFAANLATPGAIDLLLPGGQRLQGHLIGLAYTEGNQSVLIAEVKDCAAQIGGAEQNEITFADAFSDFDISVQYVLARDRIAQNVIVHQQLPSPVEWGLTENAVLEVLTEFTTFPQVRKEARESINDLITEHVSLPAMEFVTGRAFSIGDEHNSALVAKGWEIFAGQRHVLVEKLPWKSIAPEIAKLPPVAANWRKKDAPLMARNQLALPKREQARAAIKPVQVASIASAPKGYLIDWELVSSMNLFRWSNSVTHYISGSISIKTNIFEGGCVIKYAPTNTAKLTLTGPVTCLSTSYAPIVFTARDDHSIGAAIGSAALSGNYADTALYLDYGAAGSVFQLNDIRINHARLAVSFFAGRGHRLRNVQITRCDTGFQSYYSNFDVLNGLVHSVGQAWNGSGATTTTGNVQHVTFNQCSNLNSGSLTLYATNSLFVAVTNLTSFTGAYNGTNSSPSTTFQTVGAGSNYLANSSSYRNAGTTNIESALLASLGKLTTYPPIVLAHLAVVQNTNFNLSPQAGRDTDTPDLGWHYSPIDYAFGGAWVNNSTITINPGAVLATYSPTNAGYSYYGIALNDAAKMYSEGTATNPNRIVRYNTVQEQTQTTWNTLASDNIASSWLDPLTNPDVRFRFTEWFTPAVDSHHFYAFYGSGLVGSFRDCTFNGGKFQTQEPTLNVTNCLFHRTDVRLEGQDRPVSATFQNCTFYGGTLYTYQDSGGTFRFGDNLFHGVAITQSTTPTHNYNGYITNAASQWLTNSGTHNIFTNTFEYQTGALGRFYQPTNSPFINAGSTNAHLLGFYHYTVLTNNVKETNSVIDLGFHYVATTNSVPIDTDSDGIPDYLEDLNGNGSVNSGETDWQSASDGGLRVLITRPRNGSVIP